MSNELREVPLVDIWADTEFNSRGEFSPATVATLADDIEKQGLIQPIVVQLLPHDETGTKYKVVVGHRRFAAYGLLARKEPAKWGSIKSVVIDHALPEADALLMNIKENTEREPLNMLQEARALRRFKRWGWSVKRLAEALGQSKKWVEVRFGLLTLPEVIQRRAEAGILTQYQVDKILDLPTPDEQYEYVRAIVDEKDKLENLDPPAVATKRKKTAVQIYAEGVARTPAEMFLLQESIQDSFNNNTHPAAVALAWAAGVMSYTDFKTHIQNWATEAGVTYVEHEEIIALQDK